MLVASAGPILPATAFGARHYITRTGADGRFDWLAVGMDLSTAQAAVGVPGTTEEVQTLGRYQLAKGDNPHPRAEVASSHWGEFWDGLVVAEFGPDGRVVGRRLMR